MRSSRSTLRSFALLLALTGVLFRGLIPAGFMPSTLQAADRPALLVLCSHGQLDIQGTDDGDGGTGHSSFDQCPFGAATGPALPGSVTEFAFASVPGDAPAPSLTAPPYSGSIRLQPPARGPPLPS